MGVTTTDLGPEKEGESDFPKGSTTRKQGGSDSLVWFSDRNGQTQKGVPAQGEQPSLQQELGREPSSLARAFNLH